MVRTGFKNAYKFSLVCLIMILVIVGRIRHSFTQLPADPGLDRIREVKLESFRALWSTSLGYLDISARTPPLLSSLFGLRDQAIALSGITAMITVVLALIIFVAVMTETGSLLKGLICSILFAAVPSAALSTVGNHGSLKWPLFATLGIVLCSPQTMKTWPRATIALSLFVGLSNPFAILAGIGMFATRRINISRIFSQQKLIWMVLICSTALQAIVWKMSGNGTQLYGTAGVYRAWPSMGVLWFWLWIGPPVCAIAGIIGFSTLKSVRSMDHGWFALRILTVSLTIFIVTYIESGIKDSMAVASQSTALIGLSMLCIDVASGKKVVLRLCALAGLLLIFSGTFRWYGAQGNFFEGQPWRNLMDIAVTDCRTSPQEMPLIQNGISVVELTCKELKLWN